MFLRTPQLLQPATELIQRDAVEEQMAEAAMHEAVGEHLPRLESGGHRQAIGSGTDRKITDRPQHERKQGIAEKPLGEVYDGDGPQQVAGHGRKVHGRASDYFHNDNRLR